MRSIFLGVVMLAGASSSALAGDEIMANYFGNTVIATSSLGEVHVRYKPDHTFVGKATGPGGKYELSGRWDFDPHGNLCRKYMTTGSDLPPGTQNPFCTPWSAHNVGDTWSMSENGQTAQITLAPGKK